MRAKPSMKVTYTTTYWDGVGHLSSFSGYHRLVRHIGIPNRVIVASKDSVDAGSYTQNKNLRSNLLFRISGLASRLYLKPLFYTKESARVEWKCLRDQSQLVHNLYGEETCLLTPVLKKCFRKKIISTFHQSPSFLKHSMPFYWKKLVDRLDHVVVISTPQKEFLSKALRVPSKVTFIPHGVEFDRFSASTYDRDNCLMVGFWLRDFDTSLKAMKHLEKMGMKTVFDVVLPQSTPRAIIEKIRAASLKNLRVHNNLSEQELMRLYSTSRMFLMPMKDLTASNSLLEAMACGLPTVITDVGGARDYLDESCGIFVRRKDHESLAAELIYLMQDENACRSMGRKARQRASHLSWDRLVGEYQQIYEENS